MNKDHCNLAVKLASGFLLTGVATAEQDSQSYYIDSEDSLSFSLRFGLNMSAKVSGTGSWLNGANNNSSGRYTPNGLPYNYANGYVLTDVSGDAGNQTVNYGYDTAGQVTGTAGVQQYLNLNRVAASGIAGTQNDPVYDPRIGCELTYNHLFGVKEEWHHLRFGLEAAANYTPIAFHNTYLNGSVTESVEQYTYAFASGVTAPAAPFQGNFNGAGPNGNPYAILGDQVIGTQALSSIPNCTFIAQQDFRGNLWGFRLGPYLEMPVTQKLSVHVSGGFAAGLMDADASWNESITLPHGGVTSSEHGGGDDLSPLWGEYARLDFAWQFNQHWGAEVGAQYQNLGIYSHNFGGREFSLDFSQSIFVEAGISYTF